MPVSDSTACAYASAWVTVQTPQARSTSGAAAAKARPSTSFSRPRWTKNRRASRWRTRSPIAENRKWPGSMIAGVDRADRELVDALAVDLERDEVAVRLGRPDAGRDVLAQRVVAARPALVEDEPARVGVADGDDPEQVARLALVPVRRRARAG